MPYDAPLTPSMHAMGYGIFSPLVRFSTPRDALSNAVSNSLSNSTLTNSTSPAVVKAPLRLRGGGGGGKRKVDTPSASSYAGAPIKRLVGRKPSLLSITTDANPDTMQYHREGHPITLASCSSDPIMPVDAPSTSSYAGAPRKRCGRKPSLATPSVVRTNPVSGSSGSWSTEPQTHPIKPCCPICLREFEDLRYLSQHKCIAAEGPEVSVEGTTYVCSIIRAIGSSINIDRSIGYCSI